MVKMKGVATVMGIILLSVFAWVALITFVIQPNMWVGSALSVGGGMAIGVAVAFLMKRWWFKGIGVEIIGHKAKIEGVKPK